MSEAQSNSPPRKLQEQLPHNPALWAANFLRHPEDPRRNYDFRDGSGEKFLYYLVDGVDADGKPVPDKSPFNPNAWGDINVLLFARGCLKTATCTTIAGWGVDMYPTLEGAATAPVDDQRYEVMDRFKDKAEQAGLDKRREKNKLSHQKFRNETRGHDGEIYESYSHLKSRSAWGEGDKLRGIHGHLGIIDEAQDVDEGTFSTFAMEAIDRAVPNVDYFPTIFVIGTPKMANSFFHKLWKMAEKRDWDADANEWVPMEEAEHEVSVGEELQDFSVQGWHIDQYNSPLHDPGRIEFKKKTYSKKKFKNEVLAQFYSPENDLIVNDDVWAAFAEDRSFRTSPMSDENRVVMGVDWGGGEGEGAAETVATIGELTTDEHIDVCYVDVFDSSMSFRDEVEQIATLMDQYGVDTAVVDEGYGDSERQELQDEYGFDDRGEQNIYGIWYGSVKNKEDIVWNRHKERKRFFTTNKTYNVRKFSEDFKSGYITIPAASLEFGTKRDLGTKIIDQLTAPYTDRDETTSGKKKLKVMSDRADDIFDSFNYMWTAAHRVGSGRTLTDIGSTMRPGYE